MTEINETVQKMLDDAFAGEEGETYLIGYRHAIESMVLALTHCLADLEIEKAVQTALDALLNNHF